MVELSAFAGCKPFAFGAPGLALTPVEPLSLVSVSAWRGAEPVLREAARSLGLDLPPPGRWTEQAGLTAIWAGPGHWWLQRAGRTDLLAELAPLAAHAGLIEFGDGRAVLRLSGPAARDVLMGLLPLDLHPRAFGPGQVASTIAAHMTVQVRQIDDAPSYELACLRSFAGSLWRAIELAGAGPLRLGS